MEEDETRPGRDTWGELWPVWEPSLVPRSTREHENNPLLGGASAARRWGGLLSWHSPTLA